MRKQVTLDRAVDEVEILGQAQALEETQARYYRDAAAKMPVREVARSLTRLARDNIKRKDELDHIHW